MSSQRFTDKIRSALTMLALLAVAGCAGPGPARDDATPLAGAVETVAGEAVIREVPPDAVTLFEQATAIMAAGEAAREALDTALQLDPDYPVALNQLGMLLRRKGKFLEAEAAYMKAVTVSPDYALAHYNLGVLNELYLQRLEAALQHFETYQSLVGEDKQVAKWISDLRRRVAADKRAAHVAE